MLIYCNNYNNYLTYVVNTKQNIFLLQYARKDPLQPMIYQCCHGHAKYLIVGVNLYKSKLTLLKDFVAAFVLLIIRGY